MDFNLKDKRVLVAGASAGLGFATAQTLLAERAEVVINSRSDDNLQSAAAKLEQATGRRPSTVCGDLSDSGERNRVIDAVRATIGGVDILVSNTGGPPPGAFLDHSQEAFDNAAKLVLDSAVGLTRAFLPGMIKQKWGRLIYITSVGVLQPVDTLILSNTYRAAVTGFCKTVSNNYAQYGITANCVCPGYTATERLTELAEKLSAQSGTSAQEVLAGFAEITPARRLGQPDELAALITFLASDRAAYISGASIPVDGGLHKGLL
ncbi:SDR family oxidoreductase [candidate division GN15 bacterium]|nr:SDR family oxidoreductase [candidate division GN15 bacterium]